MESLTSRDKRNEETNGVEDNTGGLGFSIVQFVIYNLKRMQFDLISSLQKRTFLCFFIINLSQLFSICSHLASRCLNTSVGISSALWM